jgi:hypothetical protein
MDESDDTYIWNIWGDADTVEASTDTILVPINHPDAARAAKPPVSEVELHIIATSGIEMTYPQAVDWLHDLKGW